MQFSGVETMAVEEWLLQLINGADAIHPDNQMVIEEYFEEYGRSTLLGCAIAGYFRVHEWVDKAEIRRIRRLEKQILEATMPSGNTFGEGSLTPEFVERQSIEGPVAPLDKQGQSTIRQGSNGVSVDIWGRVFKIEELEAIDEALDADPAFDEPHPHMDLIMEYYRVMGDNPLNRRIAAKFSDAPWVVKR
ncbi:MAG: hypothetical protein EOO39_00455 [Cytophagaceae bacterium]|nr:MAG: hypothetical protein EOO39_00455 [Cytophagaceae bacterium]